MSSREPHLPVSGADMDIPLAPRRRRRLWIIAAAIVATLIAVPALTQLLPTGLSVPARDVRIATVAPGVFMDEVIVRAAAEPASSVLLDSVESGRVEEVWVKDGAMVQPGQPLFRLSNPQRRLELLARQFDMAQQLSNLSSMRVQYEAARSEYRRRLSALQDALGETRRQHQRNQQLGAQGFISQAALETSADKLSQQTRDLADEQRSAEDELRIKREALAQMEQAVQGLNGGIKLVGSGLDALLMKAPMAGRLTNFTLQVGASVQQADRVGRIDDPRQFKLRAQVDEFYLSRVGAGLKGQVVIDGQAHPVRVIASNPQVKDGRFELELTFEGANPAGLRAGQSLDCQLTLGEPKPALLLASGAFLNDSGGAWAFVLAPGGAAAERRAIRLGRRNNTQLEVLSGLAPGDRVIVSSYGTYGQQERLSLSR